MQLKPAGWAARSPHRSERQRDAATIRAGMARQTKSPDGVMDTKILVRVRSTDLEHWKVVAFERRTTVSDLVREAMLVHLGAAPARKSRKRKV